MCPDVSMIYNASTGQCECPPGWQNLAGLCVQDGYTNPTTNPDGTPTDATNTGGGIGGFFKKWGPSILVILGNVLQKDEPQPNGGGTPTTPKPTTTTQSNKDDKATPAWIWYVGGGVLLLVVLLLVMRRK